VAIIDPKERVETTLLIVDMFQSSSQISGRWKLIESTNELFIGSVGIGTIGSAILTWQKKKSTDGIIKKRAEV
jgi:hypothetical protein